MKSFAQQRDINRFVKKVGKFESVPGHVWACIGLWMHIKDNCPSLDRLVNSQQVFERLWAHDLGETLSGDISYAVKIKKSLRLGKRVERKNYIKIIKPLDKKVRQKLTSWYDEFESEGRNLPIEALVARWIDNLQGDHFLLSFGNNLSKYSETIRNIVEARSVARAKSIIEFLEKSAMKAKNVRIYKKAADDVKEVMRFHIGLMRKRKIRISLSELGFGRG